MNDEQKAQQYSNLTYGFDRIANEIASIKGESIDLNQEQLNKIQKLQEQQGRIMAQLQQIMNDY
jgi:glutamine synthetase type III